MKTARKIELAQWARETVVPFVRAHGQHHPAGIDGPTHWQMRTPEFTFIYTEKALLDPSDRSLSTMLDVLTSADPKALSIVWEPERPWQSPEVVRHVEGPGRQDLERLLSRGAQVA